MKITMEGKYQTRGESGLLEGKHPSVRILCVDGPSDEPVIGVIDGWDKPCQWTLDGHFWVSGVGSECDRDLVPVPTKHEGWCLVDTLAPTYLTRARAERAFDEGNFVVKPNGDPRYQVVFYTWED